MWGEDMVLEQPTQATTFYLKSSDSDDQGIDVTIFGTVSSYPDYEVITTDGTDGTTTVNGSKSFSHVDRTVKDATTDGRITVTTTDGNTNIAVIPAGDVTAGIMYKKVQLWPLPDSAFDMQVQYYKDPYRLVNTDDVHELGQEFDEAIILLSVAKIKYQDSQKEGDRFLGLYKDEIRNLRKTNMDKIDWFPSLRRPTLHRTAGTRAHPFLLYRQAGSNFGPASRL
jgi:hypothetical protein